MAKKKDMGSKPKKPPTPKTVHAWDAPPPPRDGDPDKETVFQAVGEALSAWEGLEEQFAGIFATLMNPDHPLAAKRAYGSVMSFRGRAELIEAAASAQFFLRQDEQLSSALSSQIVTARKFSPRRNEIAHGRVIPYFSMAYGPFGYRTARKTPSGYVLCPTDHATNKRELNEPRMLLETAHEAPKYAYSSKEVLAFAAHFRAATDDVREIRFKLFRHVLDTQKS
ncbi:MAG: hypothetical protein R8L07_14970 [Alphaproteobacteria bacterium]|nr:hypothetical protein [Alphaproteobacteria bacterium]